VGTCADIESAGGAVTFLQDGLSTVELAIIL